MVLNRLVKSLKNLLVSAILVTMLAACAGQPENSYSPSPVVDTSYVDDVMVCKIPISIPNPEPIVWRSYNWVVLNKEKLQKIMDSNKDLHYIALTPDGYEKLSLNIEEIRGYIEQQREIKSAYEEYYVPENNSK